MCILALPSNTLASKIFVSGPEGQLKDKIFGRGTSKRQVSRIDKAFKSTTPEFLINPDIGVQRGVFSNAGQRDLNKVRAREQASARVAGQEADAKARRKRSLLTDDFDTGSLLTG